MPTLIEHLSKFTDHRERDLLELTLAKALIDLLPLQRVTVAKVVNDEGVKRWFDAVTLDARGGGKVQDMLRVDLTSLPVLEDAKDRKQCLHSGNLVVVAWAGESGPRISYLPLFEGTAPASLAHEEQGVLEIHSAQSLTHEELTAIEQIRHVFCNMHRLLAYSDHDGLTGLLNRKALENTFYGAVLDELDQTAAQQNAIHQHAIHNSQANIQSLVEQAGQAQVGMERRHRVPPNYWLGAILLKGYAGILDQYGHAAVQELLSLVARVLSNTFRTYDRLYRLDNEQFAVLMHCPQEPLVLAAFERFRANVEKSQIPKIGHITAHIGFTRIATEDDSPARALARAQQAALHGRASGENTVHSYAELEQIT